MGGGVKVVRTEVCLASEFICRLPPCNAPQGEKCHASSLFPFREEVLLSSPGF